MTNALRDNLIEQERRDTASEKRFRQEVKKMTEKKLSPPIRIVVGFAGLVGLFLAVYFGYTTLTAPAELPLLGRLLFAAGALFSAVWAGLSAHILKKGSFNIKTDENTSQVLMWIFMVLMMTVFMVIGGGIEDRTRGIFLVLNGLIFFVMFAIPAIFNLRINRMELGVREQLLRMEITLLEITKNQGVRDGGASSSETSDKH